MVILMDICVQWQVVLFLHSELRTKYNSTNTFYDKQIYFPNFSENLLTINSNATSRIYF